MDCLFESVFSLDNSHYSGILIIENCWLWWDDDDQQCWTILAIRKIYAENNIKKTVDVYSQVERNFLETALNFQMNDSCTSIQWNAPEIIQSNTLMPTYFSTTKQWRFHRTVKKKCIYRIYNVLYKCVVYVFMWVESCRQVKQLATNQKWSE